MGSVVYVTSDGVWLMNESESKSNLCKGGEKFRLFVKDYYNGFRVKNVEVIYCGVWALFDGRRFYTTEYNGSWTDWKVD